MTESPQPIQHVFYAAGAANLFFMAIVSRMLSSEVLPAHDPWFAPGSVILIWMWGLAYIAAAPGVARAPLLPLVFAFEKGVYAVHWVAWLCWPHAPWAQIWAEDPLVALFLAGYGPIDALFGVFFAYTGWRFVKAQRNSESA